MPPGFSGTSEETGALTVFKYWPPTYVIHDKLPWDHDTAEIFVWPDVLFVSGGVAHTAHQPVEFSYHCRFLQKAKVTRQSNESEKVTKISKEAIGLLLAEYPWLKAEDFEETVKQKCKTGKLIRELHRYG